MPLAHGFGLLRFARNDYIVLPVIASERFCIMRAWQSQLYIRRGGNTPSILPPEDKTKSIKTIKAIASSGCALLAMTNVVVMRLPYSFRFLAMTNVVVMRLPYSFRFLAMTG